jgi:CxxC motif-containing protein
MTVTTSYLCIGCPLGCRLEVDEDAGHQIVEIRGFACKRGKEYAAQEHMAPERMVTTTVRLVGGALARLPVKTRTPVPKTLALAVCGALRAVTVTAPVAVGDVVLADVLGTGVDVVATRTGGSSLGATC